MPASQQQTHFIIRAVFTEVSKIQFDMDEVHTVNFRSKEDGIDSGRGLGDVGEAWNSGRDSSEGWDLGSDIEWKVRIVE
jgi:hypothetical protein